MGPKNRRFFLLPVSLGMLASVLLARRRNALLMRLHRRRLLFLAALSVISGAILHPTVHELGHMLVGGALGAEADWEGATWTAFSAEGPDSSFVVSRSTSFPG